jgi:hypothetical protein
MLNTWFIIQIHLNLGKLKLRERRIIQKSAISPFGELNFVLEETV